jgi:hypothetical protein
VSLLDKSSLVPEADRECLVGSSIQRALPATYPKDNYSSIYIVYRVSLGDDGKDTVMHGP